ncbi:hypothetical protein MHK_004050 [Candidatus Magnetomorum sp. HK-1]|nr:hypothetical protein MHK_004050 [Candidatus Magnetomorum sp. HK-1]
MCKCFFNLLLICQLAILSNIFFLTNVYAGKMIMQEYGKKNDNPVDNLWKFVNNLLNEKIVYSCDNERTKNLLTSLTTALNQIKDKDKRQNVCASIVPSLTQVLYPCSLKKLLSKISINRIAAKSAQNASRQYSNQNDSNASREMLVYADMRIQNMDDSQTMISSLLSLSKQFISQEAIKEGQSKLNQIREYLNDVAESDWMIDTRFKTAKLYITSGDEQSAITILDQNAPLVLKIQDERDLLLYTLCEHYLMTQKPELAFVYFDEFLKQTKDGQLKLLAQFCLNYNKNFNVAKKIITLINTPYYRFLAFTDYYNASQIDSNINLMKESIEEITTLLTQLNIGSERFEALIFLANYYTLNEKSKQGKKYLDLAKEELEHINDGRNKVFEQKVSLLSEIWDGLYGQ